MCVFFLDKSSFYVMIFNMSITAIPTLRGYQTKMRNETRELMRKHIKSVLMQAPTGSGKTILIAHMTKTAESKGMSAWFIVHRRELIKQSVLAFNDVRVKHGVIASGWHSQSHRKIQIASIQTLIRRYKNYEKPKLIIYDECHHCAAGSWNKLYKEFPDAYHIGLTATPIRLDGKGLRTWFSSMINGPTVRWLIDNGFLSDYKLYAPSKLNLSGVHSRMGDFIKSEVSAIIDKPTITGDVIKHYQKFCIGKRAVVFAVSVEHSKHVVAQFNRCGIIARHVDGETNKEERDQTIKDFAAGKIKIMSNVDLFGEGFDLPSLEAVILLRPTKSLGLYLQQVGRALRPSPGKTHAIILDHAGNCERHGLPDDEREWSLDGRMNSGKDGGSEVKIKTCPRCYAVQSIGKPACLSCGHVFEGNPREVDHVEGELVEIDQVQLRRKRLSEQSTALDEEALVELGRKRGYKRPRLWARHIIRVRREKQNANRL